MKYYVIMKIDKRYYLIDITDKKQPIIIKNGTFNECFKEYIQFVEFCVVALGENWQEYRKDYHLYIKKF